MIDFLLILKDFGIGILGFLLLEASKHFFAGTFNIYIFFVKNVKPLLWSIIGGIIIATVAVFFPQYVPFVESNIGEDISTDWSSLLITGGIVGALIKAMFEKNQAKAKTKVSEMSNLSASIPGDGFKNKK